MNIGKLTGAAPAAMATSLYGMGVNPPIKTAKKANSRNKSLAAANCSCKLYVVMIHWPTVANKNIPMKYPAIPPMTLATVAIEAMRNHLFGRAVTMAMMSGSGGIGKKELSAKEMPPRAFSAEGFSAQLTTQLYILRIKRRKPLTELRISKIGFVSINLLKLGASFDLAFRNIVD